MPALYLTETDVRELLDMEIAIDVVEEAGCKALPYLISAIQPGKSPFFLAVASDR